MLLALESPSFVVFGLRGYVSQAEERAPRLRPLARGAVQEPSGGRGCPGPAGAAPPAPALGPILRPLLPLSAVWHPPGREASSSADSRRAAEGGQSADARRWAGPDGCVGGGLHYFPLGPRSGEGRGQARPSQPRTGGIRARPRRQRCTPGRGPRDPPGGLSHAPRPAPPFLPSSLASALLGALRAADTRALCAPAGPARASGGPTLPLPAGSRAGLVRRGRVEEALAGAWGSRRAGGTVRAALDNELGSSALRPLLAEGAGGSAPPRLLGPTCGERAGCQSQVSRRVKGPRDQTSLHRRSHP